MGRRAETRGWWRDNNLIKQLQTQYSDQCHVENKTCRAPSTAIHHACISEKALSNHKNSIDSDGIKLSKPRTRLQACIGNKNLTPDMHPSPGVDPEISKSRNLTQTCTQQNELVPGITNVLNAFAPDRATCWMSVSADFNVCPLTPGVSPA